MNTDLQPHAASAARMASGMTSRARRPESCFPAGWPECRAVRRRPSPRLGFFVSGARGRFQPQKIRTTPGL